MRNNNVNKFFNKASRGGESVSPVSNNNQPAVDLHDPVQAEPLQVIVYGNNFDKAFKAFRVLVQKERILSDFKEKQGFEKPSVKKRRKRNEAARKRMELARKEKVGNRE